MGSMETLGSLAQAVSDRVLRDNIRRIMEGFRTCSDGEGADLLGPLPGSCEPQARASMEHARSGSGSRSRQGSGSLRRRSGSTRRAVQQEGGHKGDAQEQQRMPSLRTIYSSSSLGRPLTPKRGPRRHARLLPKLLTAAAGTALAILLLCLLLSRWLPEPDSADTISPRRLLTPDATSAESGPHAPARDAYEQRGGGWRHLKERSRWGAHMASHFARSLVEAGGASGKPACAPTRLLFSGTYTIASVATAEAPSTSLGSSATTAPPSPPSTNMPTGFRMPKETTSSGSLSPGSSGATSQGASQSFSGQDRTTPSAQAPPQGSTPVESTYGGSGSGGGLSLLAGSGGGSAGAITLLQPAQQQQQSSGSGDGTVSNAAGTRQGADGGGDNSGDQGGVLQYSNGYANVTSSAYTTVPHTQNWQACAAACASDASCLAWTRVAGGSADVQSCYLKSSVGGGGSSSGGVQRGAATRSMPQQQAGAVQYEDSRVLLESGTRYRDALPDALYGCPYPPSRDGQCTPPAACNCYNGICYGGC